MGTKDIITKEYMSDEERFADAFNYVLFDGRKVVSPSTLKEQNIEELISIFTNDKNISASQKYRDVLKSCIIKSDSYSTFIFMGIENQSTVHYAMPVRNMLYDALN